MNEAGLRVVVDVDVDVDVDAVVAFLISSLISRLSPSKDGCEKDDDVDGSNPGDSREVVVVTVDEVKEDEQGIIIPSDIVLTRSMLCFLLLLVSSFESSLVKHLHLIVAAT